MRKYKLDTIVREYMVESLGATQIDHRYPRLLQIAISGLRNINRDVNGLIKVEKIDVDKTNMVAYLPNDYITYRKLYVCYQGQQIALSLNANMCTPEFDDCGDLEVCGGTATEGSFFPWTSNYSYDAYGNPTGRQFGVGGGQNSIGTYRIFEDQGYIALQNLSSMFDEVIMEYLSDIDQIDGETYVHPNDVEALKAWMYWKWIQRKDNVPAVRIDMAKREYAKEKTKARKRHNSFNINDLMSAVRSGYNSSPGV